MREIRVALVACDVTQGCRTGRGRRGGMVRRRSPAKGHRTGHYATNAFSGSNWNSHKIQGIGGKKKERVALCHELAARPLPRHCPAGEPCFHRGNVCASALPGLLHHWLTSLAELAQTPLQWPLQQVVAQGREADQHRQHQQGGQHPQQRVGLSIPPLGKVRR